MAVTAELFSYKILRTDLREFVIKRVKAPIQQALQSGQSLVEVLRTTKKAMALILSPTRENTRFKNTQTLMGIFDKFLELETNPGRVEMFRGAFKLFLMEIEHDVYYRDRFNWFLEEIIRALLRGDWEERTNGQPSLPTWNETGQYGGKYSIMRHIKYSEDVVIHGR